MKKIKALFFDAGPVITLVMSRLGWTLPLLKEKFGGPFYITPAVRFELIDRPLATKRFELEALEVLKFTREGLFQLYDCVPTNKCHAVKNLVNSAFKIKNKSLEIMQSGEIESVTSALEYGNAAVVMDERTLRLTIENYKEMGDFLAKKFRQKVEVDEQTLRAFSQQFQQVPIIRSIELVSIAYTLGLLQGYIPPKHGGNAVLVDALLWATKYNGCAVTEHEIDELKNYLLHPKK